MEQMPCGRREETKATPHVVDYHNNRRLLENEVSFHWWDAAETSLHSHNFYEFFIITSGETYHELNGAVSTLSKNTLYMIRPSDCHQFRTIPQTACVHMNLCVTSRRLEQICGALGLSFATIAADDPLRATLSGEEMNFFQSRARLIGLMARNHLDDPSAVICELLCEAVSIIYHGKTLSALNYPDWFARLLEKIHTPEMLSCSACDIYRLGGFSPPVMVRYFKKYTGMTVAAYLRHVKCDYACELLLGTKLTTLEISSRLGYDSLSHFNRVFKEYAGVSPSAYRRGLPVGGASRENALPEVFE